MADGLVHTAHSIIPAGQMDGDEIAVVPAGQTHDPNVVVPGEREVVPPRIEKLRRMFDEARDYTERDREEQQIDQDYYDGPKQLNNEVREILKSRLQPPIYDNRIAPAIDGILGVIEAGKTDPRAYPRNPDDQQAAEVATKALRYITESTRFDQTKMDCAEDFYKHGVCAAVIEYDGADIQPVQIRWEEFFYDPHSRRNDFRDAKYLGIAKWMYADALREMYPDRYAEIGDPISGSLSGVEATWDDRPENMKPWVDRRSNRLMVVELYYRDERGEWLRCVYCAAGWLEFGPSPYTDVRTGAAVCPIEAISFKVNRENGRYGPIRNMRPMQDEVNARRSRGLHLLNSRQLQERELGSSNGISAEDARTEAARADGIIPAGLVAVPTADMAAGNLQMLAEAKDSLARMAPTPAVLNRQEGVSQSGRARLVVQQAGMTELARSFGRLTDWEERCYRQMWMRAQQFWTDPKWIRVTDNVRSPEFLQMNEPVMGMVMQSQPVIDPATGQPVIDPATGQPLVQNVPAMGVVGYENRPAEMDMDIILTAAPDTAALEIETFESLMELVRGGLDPFSPQFELLIEMSPLTDKGRVIDRLKAFREEAQQQNSQQQQMQAQLAQQQAAVETENKQADTAQKFTSAMLNQAKAEQATADANKTAAELFNPIVYG